MPSLWDQAGSAYQDVAGFFDHAAGSMDESIGRQFDDTPGGGFADWDTWAGIGDHAAGNVDESVGRQFDDTPGGGFADPDTWRELLGNQETTAATEPRTVAIAALIVAALAFLARGS